MNRDQLIAEALELISMATDEQIKAAFEAALNIKQEQG